MERPYQMSSCASNLCCLHMYMSTSLSPREDFYDADMKILLLPWRVERNYCNMDKCKACDKTVHFCDLLTADGIPYHKTCFKCSHCKGNLTMCSYSSMDGVLYCKPHFEQLFKETGSFSKKFQAPPKVDNKDLSRTPSRVSTMFSGTQDKCAVCSKTAYPLEKLTVEGESYHKTCFKCSHGGCTLTPSNYAALDGVLYCKHHFQQLFMEKGSYTNLNKGSRRNSADPVPAELLEGLAEEGGAPEGEAEPAEAEPTKEES